MTATTETTEVTELTPAQKARAERLVSKRGKGAAAELASIPGAKAAVNNGTVKTTKARAINPAPKPAPAKSKAAATKAREDSAEQLAEQERQKKAKADEAAARKVAADAAKEKREADAKVRAEAKAVRDAEREASRKEREDAKAAREAARAPQIMGTEYPAESLTVKTAELAKLPDLVGAAPSPRFVKSVKEHGVIEPIILVRRNDTDTTYRLAGGRRRIMAAVLAQVPEIPAIVYTVGDKIETFSEGATVHLNTLRSENVAADVQSIKRLQGTYTNEQIARETGMPLGTVKKRVRLLGLPDRFLALLYSGAVPHTVLTEASSLTADQLDELYRVFETTGKITRKDVDAMKRAGRADAADGLDFDAMMDGAPDAADVTETRPDAPIANTGNLSDDLFGFIKRMCAVSGIAFNVDGAGVTSFDRDGERIEFSARRGYTPAAPVADNHTDDPSDGADGDSDEPGQDVTTLAEEMDAARDAASPANDTDQEYAEDFTPGDVDPDMEPA